MREISYFCFTAKSQMVLGSYTPPRIIQQHANPHIGKPHLVCKIFYLKDRLTGRKIQEESLFMLLDKSHPSPPCRLPVAAQEIKRCQQCSCDTQVLSVTSYPPVKRGTLLWEPVITKCFFSRKLYTVFWSLISKSSILSQISCYSFPVTGQ